MEFGPLRQHILQLAVSGQLVEQLDSEPAVEQVGPAPKPDEVPFELPPKWRWVLVSSLVDLINGDRGPNYPNKSKLTSIDTGLPFVNAKDLIRGKVSYKSLQFLTVEQSKNLARGHILEGDFLLCLRAAAGKFGIAESSGGAIGAGLVILRPRSIETLLPQYFRVYLESDLFKDQVKQARHGSCQLNLNAGNVAKFAVALPPHDEQRRIVEVVDDLMGRLDQMEAAYSEFAGPMTEYFRNLMLDKAIRGELVPQLDTEPEVEQVGPAPAQNEVPFELPAKWKWVQAKYLGSWKSGATPRRGNAEFWDNGTVPWLKTGEVSNGLVLATEEFVTEKAVKQAKLRLNPEGSVLVAMYGTGTVGNIGLLGIPSTTNQACCACITNSEMIVNWYLFYVLLAFRSLMISKAAGTTNLQNLSKEKIENTWIPLPPIEEQRRIVAKLEEVFEGVEKLGRLMEYA